MYIRQIQDYKKRYLDLLLLGDEQESMIDRYLERGEMFVMFTSNTSQPICVAVVTIEDDNQCELKNIAVHPEFQRKGYGRQMLNHLCAYFGQKHAAMLVGTGDSVSTMTFCQRCGFTYAYTIPDFFTLHYDHPIIEEGHLLKDMVYFTKNLK